MVHIMLSLLTDESPALKVLFVRRQSWHSKILRSCYKNDHLLFFIFLLDRKSIFAYISSQLTGIHFHQFLPPAHFLFCILRLAGRGTGAFSKLAIEAGEDGSRSSMPRLLNVWRVI